MTNQEAISILKTWRVTGDKEHEALDMAISALQAQADGNCISRQAAIEAVIYAKDDLDAERIIRGLPSAKPEIVRCKDCEHRDPEDKKCDCGHAILWQLPRQDDWYCADAERRTDD